MTEFIEQLQAGFASALKNTKYECFIREVKFPAMYLPGSEIEVKVSMRVRPEFLDD